MSETVYLSPREREILRMIAEGDNTSQIAGVLHLSPETIKSHVRNLLAKLDARSRTHAITLAFRAGILQ